MADTAPVTTSSSQASPSQPGAQSQPAQQPGQPKGASSQAGVSPGAKSQAPQGGNPKTPAANALGQKNAPQGQSQKSEEAPPTDDLVDFEIDGAPVKVPKSVAKRIKDIERGFQSKAQEAAHYQKQFQAIQPDLEFIQLARQAKENPKLADQIFAKLGLDVDQFSQQKLAEKLQREMMSPEERKAMEAEQRAQAAEKRAKEFEDKENKRQEAEKAKEQQALEEKEYSGMSQEFLKAWQESGLPAHPYYGQLAAHVMLRAHAQNHPLTWAQAAAIVKEDFGGNVRQALGTMEAESIQALLGDEILKKLREHDVKRVTGKLASSSAASSKQRPGQEPASQKGPSSRPMSEDSFTDWWEKKKAEL